MRNPRPLSGNRKRFVAELFAELPRNATAAYMRTFPDCAYDSARVRACEMMKDPDVIAEIEKWEYQLQGEMMMQAKAVISEVTAIATADPRELSEYYRGACRHCYGENFRHQRTPAEFERDLTMHVAHRERIKKPDPLGLEFDHLGGVGFNPRKPPREDCPECFGDGIGYEHFKDTRDLSPAAARLFQGVKRTKDGVELKTRSQDKAIEMVGQNLGLFKTTLQVGGLNGAPILTANISATTNDPIEAAKLYQQMISGG